MQEFVFGTKYYTLAYHSKPFRILVSGKEARVIESIPMVETCKPEPPVEVPF